jgi:hypothetical protein
VSQPKVSMPSLLWRIGALVVVLGLSPAVLAGNTTQWRLQATVPVRCAILAVDNPAARPATVVSVVTRCNAQRYQLVLHDSTGQVELRAAHSSAGQAQISGGTITITNTQMGDALTMMELASSVSIEGMSVTLRPM